MQQQKSLVVGVFFGLTFLGLLGWSLSSILAQTDATPPAFSAVRAENIIGSGAQIKWGTDEPAKSPTVMYGTAPGSYSGPYTSSCSNDSNLLFPDHCVNLTGLASNTLYYYKVKSTDGAGNLGESTEFSFTSASAPVPAAPSNLTAALSASGTDVILNWTDNSSDESDFKVYERLTGGATWNLIGTTAANITTFTHSGAPSGTHEYHINACNSSGCSGDFNIVSVTIGSSGDTTAPSVPTGLYLRVDSSSQIWIFWSASTDNVGVSGYKIYRNGSFLRTASSTDVGDTGLSAATSYTYTVAAYDAANNTSPQGPGATGTTFSSATTSGGGGTTDTTPPSISNVRVENIVAPGAQIKWTTNELSDSRVTYGTAPGSYPNSSDSRCDGGGMVGDHCVNLTNLSSNTTYYYKVKSTDNNSNEATSQEFSFVSGVSSTTTQTTTTTATTTETTTATSTATTTTVLIPSVTAWGVSVDAGGLATIGSAFNTEMDTGTLNDVSVFVQKTSDPPDVASHVPVDFRKEPFSVSLTTKNPLITGVEYVSIVTGRVRSKAGYEMSADFICVFNAPGPGNNLTVCPRTSATIAPPPPPPVTTTLPPVTFLEFKADPKKVIAGSVSYPDGSPVFDAQVSIFSYDLGRFVSDVLVDTSGRYSLTAAQGKFGVGIRSANPFGSTWTPIFGQEVEFRFDDSSETKIVNFTVLRAGTKITISVGDDKGASLSGAGIGLETYSSQFVAAGTGGVHQFKYSDASGRASFFVPPGEYLVRAFLPPDRGYFNPDEGRIKVATGEAILQLVFKKREAATSVVLKGTVRFDDGTPVSGAHLWAWAERGGFVDGRSNEKGEFSLNVSSGNRWHVGATKELPTATGYIAFRSSDVIVETTGAVQPIVVVLTRLAVELPPPVSVRQEFTKSLVAETKDGAQVVIPERAAPVSGNVNVNWTPTVQAPSQQGARVVGTVYDLTIKDDAGRSVTQLDKDIQITIPYNKADLEKQGLSEDKVVPNYFDEQSGAWVKVDDYTIDKEKQQVVIRVKHLTRFALVAPADVIPPQVPGAFSGQASGPNEVTLIWVNPTADFHHVKVYRGEVSGQAGSVIDDLVTTESYKDKNVTVGRTYYYTLKSVDAAGNESSATKQVTVNVTGKAAPVTKGKFVSALVRGSRGEIVRDLQILLQKLGFFPASQTPTTFFGPITEKAVKDFQKSKGFEQVGVVGPKTRAELNKLAQ